LSLICYCSWIELAHQDLREIFEYIAEENPNAACVLLAEIRKRAASLEDNPELGRLGRVDGSFKSS